MAKTMRVQGVDLLRGLAMALMAIDHTRDFYSPTAFRPEDLDQASPALFLTRWITHFCAPTFVFLSGVSAWLYREARNASPKEHGWFLFTRGLWLIFLELIVINPWWDLAPFSFIALQVIWAIGWAMILLAVLVQGPRWLPLAFGAIVVLGHNLLDPVVPEQFGAFAPLWTTLHESGFISQRFDGVFALYPLLPWMGVMALGYGVSPWLVGAQRNERRIVIVGLICIAAFFALRLTNFYGDASTWAPDARGALYSLLGAFNVQKYPPSLLFLLMTLGPALIAFVIFEHVRGAWLKPLAVFGRVPLFYYILHLPLLHLSAVAWAMMVYGQPLNFLDPAGLAPGYEPSLLRLYVVWVLALIVLYPTCAWYDGYKRAHPENRWLRYL